MRRALQDQMPAALALSEAPQRYDEPLQTVASLYGSASDSVEESLIGRQPKTATERAERERFLELAIRQRIESRLPGRVRSLVVLVLGNRVLLDGECATYYTKQLAQHAALGVLDHDEHLENLILVNVPR